MQAHTAGLNRRTFVWEYFNIRATVAGLEQLWHAFGD